MTARSSLMPVFSCRVPFHAVRLLSIAGPSQGTGEMRMWVFGYGSLVWNPGFDVADRAIARLPDYHRSFCMRSIHHRGTDADPGLVLALDATPGAQCHGLALRAHDDQADDVLAYLRERELVSAAYLET